MVSPFIHDARVSEGYRNAIKSQIRMSQFDPNSDAKDQTGSGAGGRWWWVRVLSLSLAGLFLFSHIMQYICPLIRTRYHPRALCHSTFCFLKQEVRDVPGSRTRKPLAGRHCFWCVGTHSVGAWDVVTAHRSWTLAISVLLTSSLNYLHFPPQLKLIQSFIAIFCLMNNAQDKRVSMKAFPTRRF